MQIDDALIFRLEKLARLQLSAEEREVIKSDLANILTMVEQLQEVDVEGVEPLVYVNAAYNRLRKDEIQGQVTNEEALASAPDSEGAFFRVPKVIDL
ncbi:MAG: Asp-tRNA(Asn)/Glu-tRNA(Gln) amidotransferase subunit GatC [Saprospiraceae bacterium]